MRKSKRSARAIRILSGIVSMTMILGSFMGTGLTAYAEEEGNGNSLITTGSQDETVLKNTWKKVDGAEDYRVFYKTEGTGWKNLVTTANTSSVWTAPDSGTACFS